MTQTRGVAEVVNDRWLTREDVAELFAVPVKTVGMWAYRGTGPRFYKIGRFARYRASDVDRWAEEQRQGGAA